MSIVLPAIVSAGLVVGYAIPEIEICTPYNQRCYKTYNVMLNFTNHYTFLCDNQYGKESILYNISFDKKQEAYKSEEIRLNEYSINDEAYILKPNLSNINGFVLKIGGKEFIKHKELIVIRNYKSCPVNSLGMDILSQCDIKTEGKGTKQKLILDCNS